MKKTLYLLTAILLLTASCQQNKWEITSPAENLNFSVNLDEGKLFYQVEILGKMGSKIIVKPSAMGLSISEETLVENFVFEESEWSSGTESYSLKSGKQKQVEASWTGMNLTFSQPGGMHKFTVIARAFDDGVAFKYRLNKNEDNGVPIKVLEELTSITVPTDGKAWIPTYDKAEPWSPGYETYYTNGSAIGGKTEMEQGWSFPGLFKLDNTWMLMSEAGPYEHYCATHLKQDATGGVYKIKFAEPDERYEEGESTPIIEGTVFETPWRFFIIGNDLGTVVESNMVTNLAKKNQVKDVSWIESGKASWSWWSSTTRGRKLDTLKDYVDLAAEMGWKYSLVDAAWETMQGGTIEELVEYANEKNVGLLLWYNSGGRRENMFERDTFIMADPVLRKKEMKKLQDWGVKGLKIDFFNSDKQHVMKLYQDIMNDAAEYQLVLNFHGCTLPRGWRRTYPHLLTMEAIRGGEAYRFDRNFTVNAPWHNTIASLVRNVVGPMDYTPVIFYGHNFPASTTNAYEIALPVIFESGITHFADKAEVFRALPESVHTYLKEVPVAWDETKFIDGYPGEFVVLARKSGDQWYIAGINGTDSEKTIEPDFSFIKNAKSGYMISDKENDGWDVSKVSNIQEVRSISMLPRGGFVIKVN